RRRPDLKSPNRKSAELGYRRGDGAGGSTRRTPPRIPQLPEPAGLGLGLGARPPAALELASRQPAVVRRAGRRVTQPLDLARTLGSIAGGFTFALDQDES